MIKMQKKCRLCCAEVEMKKNGNCHSVNMIPGIRLSRGGLNRASSAGRTTLRQPNSSPGGPPISKASMKLTAAIIQRAPNGT
jgi:hypothetical protein